MQDLIKNIKSISNEFGFYSLVNEVEAIEEISEKSLIDVVVIGQFKAGKSSFINNIVDKEILPVGVTPVTAVITRIQFGESEKITVTFIDGKKKVITVKQIGEYVSETGNPNNIKKVLIVDIELPSLKNLYGLRIIDTPGIDSLFKHNTLTTKKWIPRSGVALIVISAERPLSESDLSMIEEVIEFTPEIHILISKADLFSNGQLREISSFIISNLKSRFSKEFNIYKYSIYDNNKFYREQIHYDFFSPLIKEIDAEYLKIREYKINSLRKRCVSFLNLAKKTCEKEDIEKYKLKEQILDEKMNSTFVRNELQLIFTNYISQTRESLYNTLRKYERKISDKVKNMFNEQYNRWRGNLLRISHFYADFIKNSLKNELLEISIKEHFEITSILHKANEHFTNYILSFRKRLSNNIFQVLSITLNEPESELSEIKFIYPDISISRVFDIQIDLIWFLIPMFIFKNVFKKHFLKQIPLEVEKNIHRLTSDLTEKINKEIEKIREETYSYIIGELNSVESILNSSKSNSDRIEEVTNYLNSHP